MYVWCDKRGDNLYTEKIYEPPDRRINFLEKDSEQL